MVINETLPTLHKALPLSNKNHPNPTLEALLSNKHPTLTSLTVIKRFAKRFDGLGDSLPSDVDMQATSGSTSKISPWEDLSKTLSPSSVGVGPAACCSLGSSQGTNFVGMSKAPQGAKNKHGQTPKKKEAYEHNHESSTIIAQQQKQQTSNQQKKNIETHNVSQPKSWMKHSGVRHGVFSALNVRALSDPEPPLEQNGLKAATDDEQRGEKVIWIEDTDVAQTWLIEEATVISVVFYTMSKHEQVSLLFSSFFLPDEAQPAQFKPGRRVWVKLPKYSTATYSSWRSGRSDWRFSLSQTEVATCLGLKAGFWSSCYILVDHSGWLPHHFFHFSLLWHSH